MTSREEKLAKATSSIFDIAIIGGGITGAGVLKEATLRGYTCILIEKGDFASGTSSKSAKLIHGGLRYLQYAQFGLVREGLTERNYLLKAYPHLVKPIPFTYLVYDSVLKMRLGMSLYHLLGGNDDLPKTKFLSKEKTMEKFPYLNADGLNGCFLYYDAITHDARLCNEVIQESVYVSNSVALNYLQLNKTEKNDSGVVLNCMDMETRKEIKISAGTLVNATGPWTDDTLDKSDLTTEETMAPSKGIHLVFLQRDFPIDVAIAFPTPFNDNRKLYALPWKNDSVLVGATDTEYSGSKDQVTVDQDDINYIMKSIDETFPGLNLKEEHIVSTYAGLRPLFGGESASSKDKSRDFKIWWTGDQWLNIVGGKLTTFRHMAKQLVKELEQKKQPSGTPIEVEQRKSEAVSEKIIEEIKRDEPDSDRIVHANHSITVAELRYLIRHQSCVHLADLLYRRLSLGYVLSEISEEVIQEIGKVMGDELGWGQERRKQEIDACYTQQN